MSFVALFFMQVFEGDEESAFWMMCATAANIAPRLFEPDLAGAKHSMQMLLVLVEERMPELHKHLDDLLIPLEVRHVKHVALRTEFLG